MDVTVNLYGELRKYRAPGKGSSVALRVPNGLTVRDVLEYLKIPSETALSVVVNGEHRDREHRLGEGDVLSVFSMAAFEPSPEPPSE
ncbi:MAG TPA: MoaD/ThiS family protein [Chloroflexota bacterium]|nr:MoaD/ThiS family protein [Chloroflexota bacterium]